MFRYEDNKKKQKIKKQRNAGNTVVTIKRSTVTHIQQDADGTTTLEKRERVKKTYSPPMSSATATTSPRYNISEHADPTYYPPIDNNNKVNEKVIPIESSNDQNLLPPQQPIDQNSQRYSNNPYINCSAQFLLTLFVILPPLAIAINAFCAPSGMDAKDLDKKTADFDIATWIESFTFAIICYFLNASLNKYAIPNAFSSKHVKPKKHPYRTSTALTLSLGTGVAAGAASYGSFSFLTNKFGAQIGETIAGCAFGLNGFVFSVMRFYGLTNGYNRLAKFLQHRFKPNLLSTDSRTFTDLLSHLTDNYKNELDNHLQANAATIRTEEKAVVSVLKKIAKDIQKDPRLVQSRKFTEIIGLISDYTFASLPAIAIHPVYALSFLKGLNQLVGLFKSVKNYNYFTTDFPAYAQVLLSSFSIATPILFYGQGFLLRKRLLQAWETTNNPHLSPREKYAKRALIVLLLAALGVSASGVYNLTGTTLSSPPTDNIYNSTQSISNSTQSIFNSTQAISNSTQITSSSSNIFSVPADFILGFQLLASLGAVAVNSLALELLFPEATPTPAPLLGRTPSIRDLKQDEEEHSPNNPVPSFNFKQVEKYLQHNTLSKPSITELQTFYATQKKTASNHNSNLQKPLLTHTSSPLR